ncbi:PREDICTED: uncharacterized protein LOC109226558 isoform X1 [Nicotiana attenuata]|uniref:uncharacterized protein LOC109226558 isoform X1 n=1 Tax=Nicotiana attenuata TaxID=49451 RepID=UPI00090594FD|nr:PREDICTED: uncharacterized protein LOC109226558 isoform X1 [Nicotiana attenuata]
MHRDKGFQIKTYNPEHSCKNWYHRNKTITSSFIARRYLDTISSNRDLKVSKFRDTISRQLKAHISLPQARRAKRKAIALLDGDIKDQFAMLWDYIDELERTNPGSSIHVKLTENEIANKPYIFQRIYICFAACKEGFKAGCRKIVGVDGCWLKGPMYGTQLLTAVGLDANNNIFPIAYAVVEKETRDTWSWFLNYLSIDLDIDDHGGWTFMSDKQKGLLEAFNDVLPFVSHRFCVRHLYGNFRRACFSGFSLRNALWAAAKSTTVKFFHDRMSDLLNLDADVVSWLNDKPPSEWSRSHFNPNAKCDILLNNMCESFNSMILEARDKPIITLLEKLRYILMARIQANRDKGEKWNLGDVCPRIKDILHKNEAAAAAFIPQRSNKWNYEILGESMDDNWAVDLHNKTCSCRKWTITGYPCKHAISAIWAKNDEVIKYVDDYYMVETYRRIYEYAILPINGSQLWPKSCKIPPLPPKNVKQKRGRKQKLRKKVFGEAGASRTRMKRKQTTIECSICHKPGHNKRTCKFSYVETETYLNEPVLWQSTTSSHPEKLPVRRGELNEKFLSCSPWLGSQWSRISPFCRIFHIHLLIFLLPRNTGSWKTSLFPW